LYVCAHAQQDKSGKKVKVKFSLQQAINAQRGSTGIVLLFNLVARWGWVINATPRPLYPWERNPVATV
jgi:hypothetical protein